MRMHRKDADHPTTRIPATTLVIGLGPIGLSVAAALRRSDLVDLVGAVDPSPGRAGKDLGRILGEDTWGVVVGSELEEALRRHRPQLAVLCTSSRMAEIEEDILNLVNHGCSVVSTAEELANPVIHDLAGARAIDEACKRRGVVVIAAGVNPGFVLDRLVLTLCQVTRDITHVECTRVVDANLRRPQLLTKMGAAMSPTLFAELALEAGVGHVGLRDSMDLVARGLNWTLSDYRESIVPVVARETMKTPVGLLERGQIRGATQRARGYVDGVERISYHLEIAAGSENARDEIHIQGTPPIRAHIPGGCSGDEATVSGVMAAVPFALFARPGMRLPTEMPPDPRALAGLVPRRPHTPTGATVRRPPGKTRKPAPAKKKVAKKKPAAGKRR
ncbi:MAG: Gfo/Idh/MocA family oxidoreductase [Deltaproteobacteria bacterium]|nr:Gfo/Idh/MocA family oxidoreductase [Deltaproteobacteria bacterium]